MLLPTNEGKMTKYLSDHQADLLQALKLLTNEPEAMSKTLSDYATWLASNGTTSDHDDAVGAFEDASDCFYSQHNNGDSDLVFLSKSEEHKMGAQELGVRV